MALLKVKSLSIFFGGLKAVDNFQISIEKGQLYGPTDPNRASKATIFSLLIGVHKLDTGSIELAGVNITGRKTTGINQAGVTKTPQNIRLFKGLSVLDNVETGLHNHYRYFTAAGIFHFPNYFKVEKQMDERAMKLLKAFGLNEECGYRASNLPYGKRRKLEIAGALAMEPELLLLDEPVAGVNPNETAELMDTIRFVRDNFDITILLIKHDTKLVSGTCEEPTVLNSRRALCQGETGIVPHNPEVVKAYLGEQEERII